MEEWVNLEFCGLPGYAVSSEGVIRNERTGKPLRLSRTSNGLSKVNLFDAEIQAQRSFSVPLLVARSFVEIEPHLQERFNTPINLNGQRADNRAVNLAWRPRWFAIKYHQQFHNNRRGFTNLRVRDVATGEIFPTSWEAAIKFGLLDREILHAVMNRTYLFPTGQIFEIVRD
jgi:hypothetical protein